LLTPRERAAGAYAAALAQGRGRIHGADASMVDVTEARLANVRAAQRAIRAARSAERRILREPDDARLDQMLARVANLAETLTDDRCRWGQQAREIRT
jgi:hypothetical protein